MEARRSYSFTPFFQFVFRHSFPTMQELITSEELYKIVIQSCPSLSLFLKPWFCCCVSLEVCNLLCTLSLFSPKVGQLLSLNCWWNGSYSSWSFILIYIETGSLELLRFMIRVYSCTIFFIQIERCVIV